ncbi:MAG: ZIP family metal transporter [Leptospiraceae bacterium]|nr:ZIP family metal transporter [Leptospiraceae bacterium]
MAISGTALIGTLIAGFATGLGALPVYLQREFSRATLDIGMGFSAGVMLVASFVALILPGFEEARLIFSGWAAPLTVLAGLVAGYLGIIGFHELWPHEHVRKESDMQHDRRLSRVALIVMAIALHNVPEGLAVGVGFGGGNDDSGLLLALAIAVQNMPEGLVVAIGLVSEGSSRNRAFWMALLSGLVEPVAAVIGFTATAVTQAVLPIALGFAGGAMLFVICQEMLPELFQQGHEKEATLGVILGVSVMLAMHAYL